jgi:hypothetical protein
VDHQFYNADARDSRAPSGGLRLLVEHSRSRWVSAGEVTWYGEA